MSFQYDFELKFVNEFDANVILNASIPDKNSEFQTIVKDTVNNIKTVLNIYQGVNEMSALVEYNQNKYKIIVSRT